MRHVLWAAVAGAFALAGTAAAWTPQTVIFEDDFEAYDASADVTDTDQWAAFTAGIGLATDGEAVSGTNAIQKDELTTSSLTGGHTPVDPADITEDTPLVISFMYYDADHTRALETVPDVGLRGLRMGLSYGHFDGGTWGSGDWDNFLALGVYHADSHTHYVCRVVSGGSGWTAMDGTGDTTAIPRKTGWRKMEIRIYPAEVEFYVDGILGFTDTYDPVAEWNSMRLGSFTAGADLLEGYFDDFRVALGEPWEEWVYFKSFTTPESQSGIIRMEADSQGTLYLSSSGNRTVYKAEDALGALLLGNQPTAEVLHVNADIDNAFQGLAVDSEDNVYLVGDATGAKAGEIVKYDADGDQVWLLTPGESGREIGGSLFSDEANLLTGHFGGDLYTIPTDTGAAITLAATSGVPSFVRDYAVRPIDGGDDEIYAVSSGRLYRIFGGSAADPSGYTQNELVLEAGDTGTAVRPSVRNYDDSVIFSNSVDNAVYIVHAESGELVQTITQWGNDPQNFDQPSGIAVIPGEHYEYLFVSQFGDQVAVYIKPQPLPLSVTVGPGEDYETLSEAITGVMAMGAHNNGQPVEFVITAGFTDTAQASFRDGFIDDIIITGQTAGKQDGRPVIVFTGTVAYLNLPMDNNGQTILIEDLIVIPEFDAAVATRGARPFSMGGDSVNLGNTITLRNLLFTASKAGNEPWDPHDDIPGASGDTGDATRFGTGSPFLGFNQPGSDTVYNFENVIIAHYHHTGTVGAITVYPNSGTMNVVGCGFYRNARRAIQVLDQSKGGFVINISDTVMENHGSSGIDVTGGVENLVMNIGPGTQILSTDSTGWHAIGFRSQGGSLTIEGTEENPVIITNAGQPGASATGAGVFFWDATNQAALPTIAHARISGSASEGVGFYAGDLSGGMNISNVILYGNTVVHATRAGEIAILGGNEGTVNITDVTLFDAAGVGYLLNLDSANPLTVNVTDTIFAGEDNTLQATANVTVNISNSALVEDGPHALDPNPLQGDGTYNLDDTIPYDPHFASTDPEDEDFLDVQSEGYSDAGTGGEPLGGGANWVGGIVGVMDWMEIVH